MLTGLELTFMGTTQSNSGLFSTPGFVVSPSVPQFSDLLIYSWALRLFPALGYCE